MTSTITYRDHPMLKPDRCPHGVIIGILCIICVPIAPKPPTIFGKRVQAAPILPRCFDARPKWWDPMRRWLFDTKGVAAVEFALLLAALAPVCIMGGETLGPPLLAWAQQIHADVIAAKDLAAQLGGTP